MTPALYMKRCFELAQRAKGYTAPNPMVGAVLVYNDRVIAEGWHHAYGGDHAEVDCLNKVRADERHLIPESTMYVNLEPCAHHGKTPPCAVRLVTEKVKKVVICNIDPFARVNGRGIEILNNAGIETENGLLKEEGRWLNRRFFSFHENKRPYVILKWAQSLDGYIAPATGQRTQISNSHSMQLVHKWRTEETAIMVGTATAINDNPSLTARQWQGPQPLRIVIDRSLKIPATYNIYNTDARTWILNSSRSGEEGHIRYVHTTFNDKLPEVVLRELYNAHIQSLIVEGGANLLNQFIEHGLWDEARVITGGIALGNGIAAPLLRNGVHAATIPLEKDMLNLFLPSGSGYPYVGSMEL